MFIEQAYKGLNDWWRVMITTVLTTGLFVLNFIMLFFISDEQLDAIYDSMKSIPNNVNLAMNLLVFVPLLGLLFLLVRFLHERSILSLTTARPKVDYGRIFFAFMLICIITIAGFAVTYAIDDTGIVWNFNLGPFALLVAISMLLFPIQIGFEEYLFRGYLMQQLGIYANNRWFPLIVTSIIFGLFHSANPEVAEMGYGVMTFYIGTGLLLGIMTLMDDGMELALGFHLGNNIMAALLITSDFSAVQTDAMFRYNGVENTADLLYEMIVSIAITYPLILVILCYRYKWSNWIAKLTGKVQPQNINTTDNGISDSNTGIQ